MAAQGLDRACRVPGMLELADVGVARYRVKASAGFVHARQYGSRWGRGRGEWPHSVLDVRDRSMRSPLARPPPASPSHCPSSTTATPPSTRRQLIDIRDSGNIIETGTDSYRLATTRARTARILATTAAVRPAPCQGHGAVGRKGCRRRAQGGLRVVVVRILLVVVVREPGSSSALRGGGHAPRRTGVSRGKRGGVVPPRTGGAGRTRDGPAITRIITNERGTCASRHTRARK